MKGYSPYDLLNSFKIGSHRNIVHVDGDDDDDTCAPVCTDPGDLTYTISDEALFVDLSALLDCDCDLTYDVSATPSGADSIITLNEDEKRLEVFWDTDLTPATANADGASPGVSVY